MATVFLGILWALSVGLVLSAVGCGPSSAVMCVAVLILLSAWGHVAVFPLYYRKGRLLEGFVWGCISGVTIASLIISVIVYVAGWNIALIFAAVSVAPAVLFSYIWFSSEKKDEAASLEKGDLVILFCALLIVTLFFYFPYKNLGALVGDKYLYAWLFGHDFINRIIHVESLSRGIPLGSMTFQGEYLSYYWLAYVFPSLLHNLNVISLDIRQILQVFLLFYSLLATAALVLFLKTYIHNNHCHHRLGQ